MITFDNYCGRVLSLIAGFIFCSWCSAFGQAVPLSQHVLLVVEENTSFSAVYPTGMPWLVSQGNKYGYADNFTSDVSGSLLDYLYLASGSCESDYHCGGAPSCSLPSGSHNFYCNGNNCYQAANCVGTTTKDPITDENIFHLMNEQSISWKVYVRNYLNAGGNVNVPDFYYANQPPLTHYYARHNAAVWYDEILGNKMGSQGNVVDFEQFGIDVAQGTLPRFAIIVPDGCWDAHDNCFGSPVGSADIFLKSNLPAMLNMPDFKSGGSGLLLVTFDNGNGDGSGKVYTGVIGPNVKPGYVSSTPYRHENTLRTMLDALGIRTYPGLSAQVADMFDFFSSKAGSVVVSSPSQGSTQGTWVRVNAAASEMGATIGSLEITDNFGGRTLKLAKVPSSAIDEVFQITGIGAHQITVSDVTTDGTLLHSKATNFNVSSSAGVFVELPAANSTQATFFPLNAWAVETGSSTGVDHIEVWEGATKLGDSPTGASMSQWFSLPVGNHMLTVEDVSTTGVILNKQEVSFAVSSARGVRVNSPPNNSTWPTNTVPINAYAFEQNGSITPLVDHLEVWDNTHGVKLGQSPTGVGVNSLFINQNVTLPRAGTYQLAINDVNANGYGAIHTTYTTITVK
jgi:phosphatidylinositol-3-phosphatase